MYSTNDFIHYVFADYNDTYYARSLQKLTLDEYLWHELHNASYNVVYYLSAKDNRFSLKTYGDKSANTDIFSPIKAEKKLMHWFESVFLSGSTPCAVVCTLFDFCRIFEQKSYRAVLEKLMDIQKNMRRTGILILIAPKYAEESMSLFLKSSVFDRIGSECLCQSVDNIRRMSVCHMYAELKKSKKDACIFLNRFTETNIKSILIHAQLRGDLEKTFSLTKASKLIMRQMFSLKNRDLKGPEFSPDMQFKDLFNYIKVKNNWKKLSEAVNNSQEITLDYDDFSYSYTIPVFRKNEIIRKCLALSAPDSGKITYDANQYLNQIKEVFVNPVNKIENMQVLNKINDYINDFQINSYCERILIAIENCTRLLYLDTNGNNESILLSIDSYVKLAVTNLEQKKKYDQWEDFLQSHTYSTQSNLNLIEQQKKYAFALYLMSNEHLEKLEIIIINNIANLKQNNVLLNKDLTKIISEYENNIKEKAEEFSSLIEEQHLGETVTDDEADEGPQDEKAVVHTALDPKDTEDIMEELKHVWKDNIK